MFFVDTLCVFVFGLAIANNANISSHIDSDGCILPKFPINGRWIIKGGAPNRVPGEKVEEGVYVIVKCDNGYNIDGFAGSTCLNGTWSFEVGQCLEPSPLILATNPSTLTCTTNGLISDCNTPTNGTIATDSCGPFYENDENNRNPFRIYKNGRWNKDFIFCSAVCGLDPLSSNNSTLRHFSPWTVLMYYHGRHFCAGTLINEKTILTSAICLKEMLFVGQSEPSINLVSIELVAGKRIQEYSHVNPEAQYSTIQSLYLPETFKSSPEKLISDIAVIIVNNPFFMNIWVQPACVDWSNKSSHFPHQKITSKVAAIKQSHVYEVDVPLLDDVECSELIDTKVRNMTDYSSYYQFSYTTIDKYCARNISSHYSSSCSNKIDLGAGLMTKNSIDGKQYITGITSLGSIDNDCNNNTFTLFSRISDHIGFIAEKSYDQTTEGDQSGTTCGMKLRITGNTTTQINYPWQVAIYKINSTQNDLVCGGSLISQRLSLTAAHCVTTVNGEKLPKEKFIIAVGKNYENFDDSRDNSSQFSALKEIIIPTEYKGRLENYLAAIAILVSETLFDLSKEIQPICLDWEIRYESHFLNSNVTGFVSGFTAKNQNNSQDVNDLKVMFIDQQQCKNEIPTDIKKYLLSDKLCLKFINKGKSFCRKESGDAIVFKNNKDGRYYLAGVISVWPQYSSSGCNSQEYILFTRISIYIKNFIWKAFTIYLS